MALKYNTVSRLYFIRLGEVIGLGMVVVDLAVETYEVLMIDCPSSLPGDMIAELVYMVLSESPARKTLVVLVVAGAGALINFLRKP